MKGSNMGLLFGAQAVAVAAIIIALPEWRHFL
jgi:hypothetical protein